MSSAAKVGAVMLIALAVLGYFVLKIEDIDLGSRGGKREVKVLFENVAGLEPKSAVRIAGVRKGTVRDIRVLPDGQAEVTLEVDNDVPLRANASAKVANMGLLGEKYVELDPGTSDAPVMADQAVVRLSGTQPASIDQVTDQVSAIADDVKAITASLRQVMGGQSGEQRMMDIVENVRLITSDVRSLIVANRENVDATLGNAREITAQLRVEIPRLAASIETVANQIGGTVGENRGEVRELVTNLRGLSADLRTTADNLNAITGQVKSGEGTVGKLIYDDEAHERLTGALESVESGVTSLKNTLGRVDKIGMDLSVKADYFAGLGAREIEGVTSIGGNSRTVVGLKIRPNVEKNRFFNVEMSDDPRGQRQDKIVVETQTNPATGESTTNVTTTAKFERNFLLSAQAGWKLNDVSVRIGLFDSSGGIGADVDMSEKLRFTGELFDFGKRRDDKPHARVFAEYRFRQERENTPQLFLSSGVDNLMNDTAFMFGGGIRWRDDDLKYLLGSIPIGR
ncbi:MAG: MlaD family protein [Thermoanaerobaculia bacterium]